MQFLKLHRISRKLFEKIIPWTGGRTGHWTGFCFRGMEGPSTHEGARIPDMLPFARQALTDAVCGFRGLCAAVDDEIRR